MKKRIYVETSLKDQLEKFISNQNIDLEIITDRPGDIKILRSEERKESNSGTIYSGGWIACELARNIAKKLEIPLNQMGNLLNQLNVKIRKCSLGCFK